MWLTPVPLWSQAAPGASPSLHNPVQETQGGDEGKGYMGGKSHFARPQVTGLSAEKAPMQHHSILPLPSTTLKAGETWAAFSTFGGLLCNELKEEIKLTHNDSHPACLQKHLPTSFVVSVFERVRFSRLGFLLTYICIQCLAQQGSVLRKVSVSYQIRQNSNKYNASPSSLHVPVLKNKQVHGQEKNFFFLWSGVSQQNSPLQRAETPGLLLNLNKGAWMVLIRRCLWLMQLYEDKRENWEGLKLL